MSELVASIEPMIPGLRRYARAMLHDAATADDMVQDCLERVVLHWPQRRDTDANAWTYRILHNLVLNHLRQRRNRGPHVAIANVDDDALARAGTQQDALHYRDVVHAIEALPDDQRSVLLLVSVEDLSYAQAADVLGVPVGTVMSRLGRGRERLRRMLDVPGRSAPAPALRSVR